ncbi:hypothetical protein IC608_14450 [Devosia sp. PTR5]|uniref:Uncharacterized protein n=1 Tax=Devosia oryzisoli TaxID=2774138 RepID=A0A927FVD1_9HYPH|nr:hypothetical protein [Devosia oryzisoli]MBD8066671.1 hypothetical protein [Devosia oryzisoli]
MTTISVRDPLGASRKNELIRFAVPENRAEALWWARDAQGQAVLCQRLDNASSEAETVFAAVVSLTGETSLVLERPVEAGEAVAGIVELQGRESDCFVRLDTGTFDLELCSGRAEGLGSSKWGIKHFKGHFDDFELLPSGNNAIGGFYGPFFTPENGLINPPEHTLVEIETVEKGPVLHHYRMYGTIPDGLLPELKSKTFSIDWIFAHLAHSFGRRYRVDDFRTVINGRSVTNKITVGDEFEGGQGKLVFDRFAAMGGTRYRSGDPYAGELVAMVAETVQQSTATSEKFNEFRDQLSDIESAHWDLYWRLFCKWEGVLSDEEITERLARVRAESHVKADLPERLWQLAEGPVDVSAVPHETIFPGPADKTVEFHSESGRAMIWWTSKPSGAFQIVQRRQSGWVNWGSNGENECPELPVGVEIKTAYGPFAGEWKNIATQLETQLEVLVS